MPFPKFKTKAEIPKGAEDVYEEKDGEWHPIVPDIAKAEETLTAVRKEKKDAEKLAKEAGDKAADLQRQLDVAKASGGDVEKKTKDLLDQWNKDKDAAVAAVKTELEKTQGELRTIKLDDQLQAAFLKAGGRPEKAKAALELTKKHFDLVDGAIVHKDEKGAVTTTKVEDYYGKSFRTEMLEFYTGTKAAGGGGKGGSGTQPNAGSADAAERVIKNPLQMLQEANEAAAK